MINRKGIAALLIGLAAIAALVVWQPWAPQQTAQEPGAPTSAALPDAVESDAVFAEGRISPLREALLSTEAAGLVAEIVAQEGASVAGGDALLRIDEREAQSALQQTQAALALAQANVAAAQARLQIAEEGARVAQLGIEAADAGLAALVAAPQEEAIALAESGVALANAGVAQAAGERELTLETDVTAIAAAQARLEAAEANLFAVRRESEPLAQNPDAGEDARAQAQLRLDAALAAFDAARAELEALQSGATEAQAQAAGSAVAAAAQQRAAAQAEVALLQAGPRPEVVQIAEAEAAQARQTAAEVEAQVGAAQAAVGQAQAQLEVAEANVQAAQTALERHTVRAPFDGVVVQVMVKAGQSVALGSPVVMLADLSGWRVNTSDLTELDVVRLREGQAVQVRVDAFPHESFSAEVAHIAGAPAASGDDVTYEVTALLPATPDVTLRWGMTAFLVAGAPGARSQEATPPDTMAPAGAVTIEGAVEPAAFLELALQDGGMVAALMAQEGQQVEAGETLLTLDGAQQEIALAQAQGQLAAAQAGLQAARSQLAAAQSAVQTAQAQADVAQARLALAQSGPLPEELAAAESRLAAAQSGVAQAAAARDALLQSVGTAAQIEAARAEAAAAAADLRTLQDGYEAILDSCFETPEGTVCPLYGSVEEATRAQLEAAQARAGAAQTALQRLQSGPTAAQQQAANAGVSLAVARRQQAAAQLALLQAGATPEAVRQAQAGLAIAQAQIAVAQAGVAQAQAAVAQAEAGVQAAQAGVQAAQLALERTRLTAPFSGVVVQVNVNEGELAAPQMPLLTLAGFSRWQVATRNLTELDLARIAEGDEVTITFDALPQARLQGVIETIALSAGMDRGDVVYETTIMLPEDMSLALRWGMTAVVDLQ